MSNSPKLVRLLKLLTLKLGLPIMRLTGFGNRNRKSVLYVGQSYYNNWYLSRALRKIGWKADVLNWDTNPNSQIYYHGEDFRLHDGSLLNEIKIIIFYFSSIWKYDVFHFSNKEGLHFGNTIQKYVKIFFNEKGFEVRFLKSLGKKIIYSNNGCLDGVSQTIFSRWGPESVCSICRWQNEPDICSDELNLAWGKFRNELADYQCTIGGNRADFNDDPRVHEVPEYYCLDKNLWRPDLEIPMKYRIQNLPEETLVLYHAVGNRSERTRNDGINIKSSHIYLPLIDRLRLKNYKLELLEPSGIPNREVRYLQAQSDIFLDMLTYGWFGANAREAMMLGKPVICFLRPEWLESVRQEMPSYVDELPIISATPDTVEAVLCDLIENKEKRLEIGRRSREFSVKWHSAEVGAQRLDRIYCDLLGLQK